MTEEEEIMRREIVEEVFSEFVVGRFSFRREGLNTIEFIVNNRPGKLPRVRTREQAWKVAQDFRKRIHKHYNGGVFSQLIENNIYDEPIKVRFWPSYKYVQYRLREKTAHDIFFSTLESFIESVKK